MVIGPPCTKKCPTKLPPSSVWLWRWIQKLWITEINFVRCWCKGHGGPCVGAPHHYGDACASTTDHGRKQPGLSPPVKCRCCHLKGTIETFWSLGVFLSLVIVEGVPPSHFLSLTQWLILSLSSSIAVHTVGAFKILYLRQLYTSMKSINFG